MGATGLGFQQSAGQFFAKSLSELVVQAGQWGWLHAVPEGQKRNRLKFLGGPRGIKDDLPGRYLLEALWQVGPADPNTGGPILWQELAAYASVGCKLQEPWEFEAVMSMSRAYVQERKDGVDPLRIAPVDREAIDG